MSKNTRWTETEKWKLGKLYPANSCREISVILGKSVTSVKTALQRYGFSVPRKWTPEKIDVLRKFYENTKTEYLAKQLGLPLYSVYNKAYSLGLKKAKEHIAEQARIAIMNPNHPGRKFIYGKGHKSWNKGMKGLKTPGSEKGWFKKGHLNGMAKKNYKPVGTVTVVHNHKRGTMHVNIKIGERKWRQLARVLWEQRYGPIPKGMFPVTKDRNPLNMTVENLELVDRKEHGRRWQFTDGAIAKTLARSSKGKGAMDREKFEEFLRHPELLELKRKQLELQQQLKESTT